MTTRASDTRPAATDLDAPGSMAWDLLVVGGGTAGIVAATTATSLGASVLLVERDRTGGDCLWTGCVPSKSLLAAAAAAADAHRASELGVLLDGVRVDFAAVMAHVKAAITAIEPNDSVDTLTAAGIQVVRGGARFTGPRDAEVEGRPVRFRQALLATGSEPSLPPIPGLSEAHPMTSDSIWSLTTLPARLVVLGAGSIGCELGQAFARLGSQVTIIEAAPRVLAREDPDAAAVVAASVRRDGATLLMGLSVTEVCGDGGGGELLLEDGQRVGFDQLLVAVGRRPRSDDLGLQQAQVGLDERGYVTVDAALRTSNRRIWAAGDVTGHPAFTHVAGVHGALAASNAILGLRRRVELTAIPRVTFTQPELAAVGVGTSDAARHPDLTVHTIDHVHVDRAVTEGHTDGFTRLVLDRKGHILGASVVGPRAGETLSELVLAIRRGLRARDLAATVHAYPTYGYGAWDAALQDLRARLRSPAVSRIVASVVTLRRHWLKLRDGQA